MTPSWFPVRSRGPVHSRNTLDLQPGHRVAGFDLAALFLLAAAVSLGAYHPFYFGDELTAFFRPLEARAFANVFSDLNSYKPRLLFNGLWALYGMYDVPRAVPMVVNLLCLWGAASMLYLIARRRFEAPRAVALLVGVICLSSRFGVMLGFDYLSGNIETLSALLFFSALYHALAYVGGTAAGPGKLLVVLAFATGAVLVHERYIAATFVLGLAILLEPSGDRRQRLPRIVAGAAVALLPFVVFYVAGKQLASLDVSTGTSGQSIDIGTDTVWIAVRYLANLFLGTNFGLPWFVGSLGLGRFPGTFAIPLMATSAIVVWAALLRHARNVAWTRVLLLAGLVLALVAVAALPGIDKQESRWMFPVAGLVSLLVVALARGKGARAPLLVYLVINLVYLFSGSYRSVFNVEASTEARQFGLAFAQVPWNGKPGVLLDAPQPQTGWWLGGNTMLGNDAKSGRIFCRANFDIESACVVPGSELGTNAEVYDFGLRFSRRAPDGSERPTFTYIAKQELLASRNLAELIVDAARERRSSPSAWLELSPRVIEVCGPDAPANIEVRWSVDVPGVESVVVWIVFPGEAPIVFANADAVGTAKTGNWVASELSFVVVDPATNAVLAVDGLEAKPCMP